jgi:hypothetical protein
VVTHATLGRCCRADLERQAKLEAELQSILHHIEDMKNLLS